MRSPTRRSQKVFVSHVSEKQYGYDTIRVYSNPKMIWGTVSFTSGLPDELSDGRMPTYDKTMTVYQKEVADSLVEGDVLWVDREPDVDASGALTMQEDGLTLKTEPDYVLVRAMTTRKALVYRYGINKIGGS